MRMGTIKTILAGVIVLKLLGLVHAIPWWPIGIVTVGVLVL